MKTILITALALLGLAFTAQTAQAEPEVPIIRGSLEVQVFGAGKVTGTGIDCGTDCTHSTAWRENELPPTNRLTATPNTGWALSGWAGCPVVAGQPTRCDATYGTELPTEVTARFVDVQPPTVFIAGYNDRPGRVLHLNLNVNDNHGVDRVEILLNGQVIATRTANYWTTEVDVSGVPEGVYALSARAWDAAGNHGVSAVWEIEIDHTGPDVTLNSPVAATNADRPSFSFDSSAGDYWSAECAIRKQGETGDLEPCGRGEWYSADTPTEGNWTFVVEAKDSSGNVSRVEHGFVVDRTAPVAAFTSGPADGSVVEVGNVKYAWSVTDGLPVTQECSWDNGEAAACAGTASRGLTAGAHSFRVVLTDQAGNQIFLARTVNVKKDGKTPDPDERPGSKDRTAPLIRLVAPKQKLKDLRRVLRLNVRCNEACSGRVVVQGKGGVRFAGRVSLARAGAAKLKLRPTAKVRKRLLKLGLRSRRPRPMNLTATATLKDKAGNTGEATLTFKARR